MLQKAIYTPQVFDVRNMDEARRIILTPEADHTSDDRWRLETAYLDALLTDHLSLSQSAVVIDYGCGIGRLAKELIVRTGCRVIGVDISRSMRALAEAYVDSDRFQVCAPAGLVSFGEQFADAALAVWVLQHIPNPEADLDRLHRALKPRARLFIVNERRRCIPTDRGWQSDAVDLAPLLAAHFDRRAGGALDPISVTPELSERAYWEILEARHARAADRPPPATLPNTAAPERTSPPAADSDRAPASGPVAPAAARSFMPPASLPTQEGPHGIRYDFNDGCRLLLPEGAHPWRVRLTDLDTGNVLFETEIKAGRVHSSKRYFVRIGIEISADGERVFRHEYAASGRPVLIQFPVGTLGDPLGWLPYAVKFQAVHGCRLTCLLSDKLIPLFVKSYPDITFVTKETLQPETFYATYSLGLFFDDKAAVQQPCDFRHVGLHRTAAYILGVDPTEEPAAVTLDDASRPVPEPYVCIAVQSTTQSKYWNNPNGWREIVAFLKQAGYRVICIDQKPTHGMGLVWNHIPNGAEDETGDRPLLERARWLEHAEFFVGLSSGLSWLAWTVGTPVVMISGFTHPTNEFTTPHRVINYHACNSCWNDVRHRFDHADFLYCPRHKDTPRQFECTRLITVHQVKETIRRVPGFPAAGTPP